MESNEITLSEINNKINSLTSLDIKLRSKNSELTLEDAMEIDSAFELFKSNTKFPSMSLESDTDGSNSLSLSMLDMFYNTSSNADRVLAARNRIGYIYCALDKHTLSQEGMLSSIFKKKDRREVLSEFIEKINNKYSGVITLDYDELGLEHRDIGSIAIANSNMENLSLDHNKAISSYTAILECLPELYDIVNRLNNAILRENNHSNIAREFDRGVDSVVKLLKLKFDKHYCNYESSIPLMSGGLIVLSFDYGEGATEVEKGSFDKLDSESTAFSVIKSSEENRYRTPDKLDIRYYTDFAKVLSNSIDEIKYVKLLEKTRSNISRGHVYNSTFPNLLEGLLAKLNSDIDNLILLARHLL